MFSCLEAFLQIFAIWVLKFSSKSIVTPKSFTSSSHFIILPLRLKEIFSFLVFFPIAIAWNLSGFAFIWFSVNQSIKVRLSLSSTVINWSRYLLLPLHSVLQSLQQLWTFGTYRGEVTEVYSLWWDQISVIALAPSGTNSPYYRYIISILTTKILQWVSGWLLFNANSAIFQLYHSENKLFFNEMIMRSALYETNTLSWFCIVLAHWNNSPQICMSPHSDTLSWFRANQSLLFLLMLRA